MPPGGQEIVPRYIIGAQGKYQKRPFQRHLPIHAPTALCICTPEVLLCDFKLLYRGTKPPSSNFVRPSCQGGIYHALPCLKAICRSNQFSCCDLAIGCLIVRFSVGAVVMPIRTAHLPFICIHLLSVLAFILKATYHEDNLCKPDSYLESTHRPLMVVNSFLMVLAAVY